MGMYVLKTTFCHFDITKRKEKEGFLLHKHMTAKRTFSHFSIIIDYFSYLVLCDFLCDCACAVC